MPAMIDKLRESLIYMRPRLELAIHNAISKPRDPEIPVNVGISWVTGLDTAERLLDAINELSMIIGDYVQFKDLDGEIKSGVLRHITRSFTYHIDVPDKKTAYSAKWVDGELVRIIP